MKQIALALFALTLSLPACARSRSTPQLSQGDSTRTLTFDGIERSYILHIPPSYDGSHAMPLVLSFHGGGGNAENEMRVSNFSSLADEKGFIVVYPNGTGRLGDKVLTWNGGTCCGYAITNQVDDAGSRMTVEPFSVRIPPSSGLILLDDPLHILNQGDSGGGVFYNNKLIGNLWMIYADGRAYAASVPAEISNSSMAITPILGK